MGGGERMICLGLQRKTSMLLVSHASFALIAAVEEIPAVELQSKKATP